ncbi:peptidoglycan recognition protein-like [Vanessa cardui]|uniref:peptidoglycan recognition protein-like n=1 Tax=Vanessa cardui TaxID=171605 RepID=UPI001F13E8A6|nr:peptidoglycan recognition protein-like [Vanessa cardui]
MAVLNLMFLLFVISSTKAATVPECNVVPIAQWSGSESNRKIDLPKPVNLVIIQHTVSQECYTDEDCERIANGIRNYLMEFLNYDDIGQSFLIGGNGKVYEGAGWRVGAHTRGYNERSIGLSFMGDFRDKLPTPQALQAAQDFLNCAVYKNHLGMNYSLVGHQQVAFTLSPGAALQNLIQSWPHWVKDASQV